MERPLAFNFIMLKPLGAQEPLRGEIIEMLQKVATIAAVKRKVITLEEAQELYRPSGHDVNGKALPHFHAITGYLADKTVEVMIALGNGDPGEFIKRVDEIIGPWQPEKTREGQVRNILIAQNISYIMPVKTPEGSNKYCYDNLIHSSDSVESALREMSIHFSNEELKQIFRKKTR